MNLIKIQTSLNALMFSFYTCHYFLIFQVRVRAGLNSSRMEVYIEAWSVKEPSSDELSTIDVKSSLSLTWFVFSG